MRTPKTLPFVSLGLWRRTDLAPHHVSPITEKQAWPAFPEAVERRRKPSW